MNVLRAHAPCLTRRYRWMKGMLASTLVFNLFDAILTLMVVTLGLAIEANPVMAAALDSGALLFVAVKLSMVSVGVLVLWRFRQRPMALAGATTAFLAYAGITLYHLQSIRQLVALL